MLEHSNHLVSHPMLVCSPPDQQHRNCFMLRNAFCSFRDKFYPGCRAAVVVRMNATKVRTHGRSMFVFLIPLYRVVYWRHLQLCSCNGDFCKTWEEAGDCCVQEREISQSGLVPQGRNTQPSATFFRAYKAC